MVRRGDPGRVLVHVEVAVQVRVELRPGGTDPVPVSPTDIDLGSEDLEHQVRHQFVESVGGECDAPLHALMDLELQPRERRHDEEVAIEVGHRLFDDSDLERGVGLRREQVTARKRLVHV